RCLTEPEAVYWHSDAPAAQNYLELGSALAKCHDLYRRPDYGAGLLLAADDPNVAPRVVEKGSQLSPIIADRLHVFVVTHGKARGGRLPAEVLSTLLGSEVFLQHFRPLDRASFVPMFIGDNFRLTEPGYNDAGRGGGRILYVGEPAQVSDN